MRNLKTVLSALVIAILSTGVIAQEKGDAIKAFNQGLEQAKAEQYDSAINSFTQAATIAEQLGDNALKERAQKQIPGMYYKKAVSAYNVFKTKQTVSNLDAAIAQFEEAGNVSEEYGDENIRTRVSGLLPQLLYNKSLVLFKQEKFEEAGSTLNEVINRNSNYALAYYQKGLVDNKLGKDIYDVLNWYDQAIEVAENTNQPSVARRASESAHDNLLFRGVKAMEAGRTGEALELLEAALSYDDESADLHYRLSEVTNKIGDHNAAISHATKALDFESGGRNDKAKIYFELGFAHQAKGDKAKACDAFSNAVYGAFKEPAEHKMEFELKCSSAYPAN